MSDSLNTLTLSGNLGRDAEVRYTQGGTPVVIFTLAVSHSRRQPDGSYADETSWIDCTFFGKRAEALQQRGYLQKGVRIAIIGHLRQNRWEKDGKKFYKLDVIVDNILTMTNYRAVQQAQQPAQSSPDVYDEDIPF